MRVRTTIANVPSVVLQREESAPELIVVLCHGYGAPSDDLVPLGEELLESDSALACVRFVFPEAPLDLADLGNPLGRAWWHIDFERLLAYQRGDAAYISRLRQNVPEGLSKARNALAGVVAELTRVTGLPYGRVVLGGFSQGAMLATDLTLRLEEAPAALAILSGTLLCEREWAARAPKRAGLRVLQSHGTLDPLLPFAEAQALCELLRQAGLAVEFLPFEGPHTIPFNVVERLGAVIRDCVRP